MRGYSLPASGLECPQSSGQTSEHLRVQQFRSLFTALLSRVSQCGLFVVVHTREKVLYFFEPLKVAAPAHFPLMFSQVLRASVTSVQVSVQRLI